MEGAPHTAKRTIDLPLGFPPPPYIKEGRRRRPTKRGAPWGSPTRTPLLVGFAPLFPFLSEGKRKERERGLRPPLLV